MWQPGQLSALWAQPPLENTCVTGGAITMPLASASQFVNLTPTLITADLMALAHDVSVFILRCKRAHAALTARSDAG